MVYKPRRPGRRFRDPSPTPSPVTTPPSSPEATPPPPKRIRPPKPREATPPPTKRVPPPQSPDILCVPRAPSPDIDSFGRHQVPRDVPDVAEDSDYDDVVENEVSSDDEGDQGDDLKAKNANLTVWSRDPPPTSRSRIWNMVAARPGLKGDGLEAVTMEEFFRIFFTDPILQLICDQTNRYAHGKYMATLEEGEIPQDNWRTLEKEELLAFIGLLIRAGAEKSSDISVQELWSTKPDRKKIFFQATMPRDRFVQILSNLRFDDTHDRHRRKEELRSQRLLPVMEMFEALNMRLREVYEPGPTLTLDETLISFRGNAPFRVYIKSKPGRYGLKVWSLADPATNCVMNMQIYSGMRENDQGVRQREVNQGKRVALELMEPWLGAGRGLTADNFFSTLELAEDLLKKNTTYLGTLRSNRKEVPPAARLRLKEGESSYFFAGDATLLAYGTKKPKPVLLLSTQHRSGSEREDARGNLKPEMILDYNATKGGVDTFDWMVGAYKVQRGTMRWPLKIFYFLVDVMANNAYSCYIMKHPEWNKSHRSRRREFLMDLSQQLVLPQIRKRAAGINFGPNTRDIVASMEAMGVPIARPEVAPYEVVRFPKERRCRTCPKGQKKTKNGCSVCKNPICKDHEMLQRFCPECVPQVLEPIE